MIQEKLDELLSRVGKENHLVLSYYPNINLVKWPYSIVGDYEICETTGYGENEENVYIVTGDTLEEALDKALLEKQ